MTTATRLILVISPVLAMMGCPVQETSNMDPNIDTVTVSLNVEAPPCPGVHPAPDEIPADALTTPRADAEAEQLAFEAACALAAPEALYQRVNAELTGIRATYPRVRDVHAYLPYSHDTLLIGLDEVGIAMWQAGDYTAWNTLNQAYGARTEHRTSYFLIHFSGRHNLPLLARQYRRLPHVHTAALDIMLYPAVMPNPVIDDVCLAIDGNDHHYLFTSGHVIKGGFRVDADGNISALDAKRIIERLPLPEWYQRCITWLS